MKILRYFSLLFLLLCGCKGPQFTADTGYDGVRNNSNKPISNTNIGDQNSQNNPYTNNIGANTGITIPNSYFPIGSYVQPLPNYYISNQGQPTTPSNNNIGNQTQPVPSEKIVYINQICRPVDIPSRNISGVKLKVYSTNGNFIKEHESKTTANGNISRSSGWLLYDYDLLSKRNMFESGSIRQFNRR